MDFKDKWCGSIKAERQVLLALSLVCCALCCASYKYPDHHHNWKPQTQFPLYNYDEPDFHYESGEYAYDEGTDYGYPEPPEPFSYQNHNPSANHRGMVDKHMLGYYNFNKHKKPGFSAGDDYPQPEYPPPYYDDGYLPPEGPGPYQPPPGPGLPPIYPLAPGGPEPPYAPPPFSSPDPGFKTQTGFEGFLVPNSWYGLLPWGIEGVIIVIAGIIIFVIIVIAIIAVIAWLVGIRKVVPNVVHSLKRSEMESRMFNAWRPPTTAMTTNLTRLSAQVLSAIEMYEGVGQIEKTQRTRIK